ncbi:MAG: hypothetical protein NVS3B14_02820 [Ktedonobacteraceae bacterium]
MGESPERHTAAGYFITIIAVLGGAFLITSLPAFFITIAPLLLLLSTPVLLIGFVQYRQRRRSYSQEPVAVSQSSTSSDM